MEEVVKFEERGAVLSVALTCEIDHHTARTIRDKIDKKLFTVKPDVLELDFSAVRFMDSSGVGLIIGRCSVCESIRATVRVVGLSALLMKLVRLSGIEKIKNLCIYGASDKPDDERIFK